MQFDEIETEMYTIHHDYTLTLKTAVRHREGQVSNLVMHHLDLVRSRLTIRYDTLRP